MIIEQIYTGCLAQGAYFIESQGEVAIIDPLREVKSYIDKAEKSNAKIKYIFETHFHADFVSGHLDLAKQTGAPIVYGPMANPSFEAIMASDGQEFKLGALTIRVLHTPGHTMESTCYLLINEKGEPEALFSGDTLFLGDVGRPDLAQKAAHLSMEDLAGHLYDSLMNKIMPLPDHIMVYPAHGAGSACGKNMMKETMDTLGNQKRVNYALNQPNKESFIKEVTSGLSAPPAYFPMNVAMNKNGYADFDSVLQKGMQGLEVSTFEAAADATGALILDTRSADDFAKGFIPNSINIGIKGDFAPWVGAMIGDVNQNILLVCAEGTEQEVITRLARVGFDQVLGYLKGGIEAWTSSGKEIDTVNRITPAQFEQEFKIGETVVFDVRKEGEYAAQHVDEAYHRPLSNINEWFATIDKNQHIVLHCQGGYRSMIAASILQSRGFRNFKEVAGGFKAISESTQVPTSDFVCQSKILA